MTGRWGSASVRATEAMRARMTRSRVAAGMVLLGLIPVAHTDPAVFKPLANRTLDGVRFLDSWPTDA